MTDFSCSYVRWSIPADPTDTRKPGHIPWGNSARTQIDVRYSITGEDSEHQADFSIIAPCRKEWMYRESELIMDPGGEYRVIFSRERKVDVAMSSVAGDRPLPMTTSALSSLEFEVRTISATPLASDADVVAASASGTLIVARTEIANEGSGLSAMLEYPVRTTNFHPERLRFQVDTGPRIFADLSAFSGHPIDCCHLAHTVFNTFEYAEFVCRSAASISTPGQGPETRYHYSEVHRVAVVNSLFGVTP